jgi:hypothetical protein
MGDERVRDDGRDPGSGPDLETLRLIYGEVAAERIAMFEVFARRRASLLALPTAAGAVLAFFAALKSDTASTLVSALYAVGAIPLVLIVLVCAAEGAGMIGFKIAPWPERPADDLALADWLAARIESLRGEIRAVKGTEPSGRRVRAIPYSLFAIEVAYLAIVASIAPFID